MLAEALQMKVPAAVARRVGTDTGIGESATEDIVVRMMSMERRDFARDR